MFVVFLNVDVYDGHVFVWLIMLFVLSLVDHHHHHLRTKQLMLEKTVFHVLLLLLLLIRHIRRFHIRVMIVDRIPMSIEKTNCYQPKNKNKILNKMNISQKKREKHTMLIDVSDVSSSIIGVCSSPSSCSNVIDTGGTIVVGFVIVGY